MEESKQPSPEILEFYRLCGEEIEAALSTEEGQANLKEYTEKFQFTGEEQKFKLTDRVEGTISNDGIHNMTLLNIEP
jgi:hypothetical protein